MQADPFRPDENDDALPDDAEHEETLDALRGFEGVSPPAELEGRVARAVADAGGEDAADEDDGEDDDGGDAGGGMSVAPLAILGLVLIGAAALFVYAMDFGGGGAPPRPDPTPAEASEPSEASEPEPPAPEPEEPEEPTTEPEPAEPEVAAAPKEPAEPEPAPEEPEEETPEETAAPAEPAPERRKPPVRRPERASSAPVAAGRMQAEPTFYAAGELLLSGGSFYRRFFSLGWPTTPDLRELTARDAHAMGGDTLEAIDLYSGVGVPVHKTAYFLKQLDDARAAERGPMPKWAENVNTFLAHRLETFADITGYDGPLASGFEPIALELDSADPAYARSADGSAASLRWDASRSVPTITPAALGLSIHDAVVFAREHLRGVREIDRFGVKQTFIGRDPRDAFTALVLLDSAVAKLHTLREELVFDGKVIGRRVPLYAGPETVGVDYYFPHYIGVTFVAGDPVYEAKRGGDGRVESHLFDSAALLLAATELYDLARDDAPEDLRRLFDRLGIGKNRSLELFRRDTYSVARDLVLYEFERLASIHLHPRKLVFFSIAQPGEQPDSTLFTVDAGLTLVALSNASQKLTGPLVQKTQGEARRFAGTLADLLLRLQGEDGSFRDSYDIEQNVMQSAERSLAAQGMAIRGLVAAFRATGKEEYKDAAMKTLRYLEEQHWDPYGGVYRASRADEPLRPFTLMDVAATIGGLRELAVEMRDIRILFRFGRCLESFRARGLHRSETERGGERGDGRDADADSDGIPDHRSPAPGAPNGVAPVLSNGLR